MSEIRTHAQAIVINGEAHRNALLCISEDNSAAHPSVIPFTTETAGTTSFNGILIVAPASFSLSDETVSELTPDNFSRVLAELSLRVPALHPGESFQIIRLPL